MLLSQRAEEGLSGLPQWDTPAIPSLWSRRQGACDKFKVTEPGIRDPIGSSGVHSCDSSSLEAEAGGWQAGG